MLPWPDAARHGYWCWGSQGKSRQVDGWSSPSEPEAASAGAKRGEASSQGGSLIRTLSKKHLDFSEAWSCCEFLHLLWASCLCSSSGCVWRSLVGSPQYSRKHRWQVALSLMGHTRVRRQSVSLYRIPAGLWLGPSLSDPVSRGRSLRAPFPGTVQRLVHGRRSVDKLNSSGSSPPGSGLLFTANSSPHGLPGPHKHF